MLLGIFSDTHLGFGDGDLYEESFARFKEALGIFKEKKVNAILHAGDLFDDAVPKQEVWLRAFECFSENGGNEVEMTRERFGAREKIRLRGIPFIAIHGTHEFRGKDFVNALEVLESAGCMIQLHGAKIILENFGEKIAIQGLGGVPERNAKQVLEKFDPKPASGAVNILLLHQSFIEFLPFGDEAIASLSLSNLPSGFDLIVDGHLHWHDEQNVGGKRFLLTGSTIFTQMKKLEAKKEKGVFLFDTKTKKIEFVPFAEQRKLFYEKISFKDAKPEEVKKVVEEKVSKILCESLGMKPLIRFKLMGTLSKGFLQSDVSFDFGDGAGMAVFSISKEFSAEQFGKKIGSFKEEHLKKKSILEIGVDMLEKHVEEAKLENFETRRIFDLLAADETEKAEKVLLGE
ncbi:MAG: metallophosphoesterase [Candidatus Diapherotrites archaeon]|nr:metallophosphoesterase [Candidatus Diapherotrites archaeon]